GLLVLPSQPGNHWRMWRSATALATGPSTSANRVSAATNFSDVSNGTGPAPALAATPKISTGIVSGRMRTATSSPPRGKATASAAPINPRNVIAGVPISSVSVTVPSAAGSTPSSNPNSGAAIVSGSPVATQCAAPF